MRIILDTSASIFSYAPSFAQSQVTRCWDTGTEEMCVSHVQPVYLEAPADLVTDAVSSIYVLYLPAGRVHVASGYWHPFSFTHSCQPQAQQLTQ